MALILTQTDTTTTFNVGCSGRSAGATTAGRSLVDGGTAGVTEFNVSAGNNVSNRALISFRTSGGIGEATWDAGDYVVRLNVTTAKGTNTWTETHICERTSGGAYNTVASLTGQSVNLSTTGVKTMTVNRATDYTPAGTDSDLFIVVVVSNSDQHGNASLATTPDQNIDTPITTTTETILQPDSLTHSHTIDESSIDVSYTVSPNDLLHNHSLEETSVESVFIITPNGLVHSHNIEQSSVTVEYGLVVNDVQHGHSIDDSSVDVSYTLVPADLLHNHLLEESSVDYFITLTPDSLTHSHAIDEPSISVVYTITTDGLVHSHLIDTSNIDVNYSLSVEDLLHNHTIEETSLEGSETTANTHALDISSNSAQVVNGNNNYVYLLNNITDGDFWNNVKEDGGDLRLYHSESRTRLPIDLVYIDSGSTSGELHFYTTHSQASTSTDYTLEWGASSYTQPDPTGSYGRNAVWQEFEAVLHLNETGSIWKDATGNNYSASIAGGSPTPTTSENPFGRNWVDFSPTSGDDYLQIENSEGILDNTFMTVTCIANSDDTTFSGFRGVISNRVDGGSSEWLQLSDVSNGAGTLYNDGTQQVARGGTSLPNSNTWFGFTANSSALRTYKNGSNTQTDSSMVDGQIVNSDKIYIGSYFDFSGRGFDGKIGEIKLYKGVRSPAYKEEEHNNQSDNGNFWTTGAVYTLTESSEVELQPDGLTHSHIIDSTSIDVKYSVSPNNLLHNHQIEQTTVNVKYTIQPNDLAHQHLLDETIVDVNYSLNIEDLTHAHSLDETEVSVLYELLVNDLQHNHSIDEVGLIPHYILTPEDLQHNHLLEDTSLQLPTVLLQPESLTHAHTLDNTTVNISYSLEVDGVLHTHTIDNVELTAHYIITPEDLEHLHTLDEVILSLVGDATKVSLEENELFAINLEEQKLYKITLADNKIYTVQLTEEELLNTSTTENEKLNITLTEQETAG